MKKINIKETHLGVNNGENDHIYIFRPNETALGKGGGDLTKATLNSKRPILGKEIKIGNDTFDNETIYYSNGSNSGITIEVVSETDKSVTFNVNFPSFDGQGPKDNPYLIYDIDTFLYFMKTDTKNKYYKLMNDLDFERIGNYPKIDFEGNLNGNNKTIKNISATDTGVFSNIGNFKIHTVIENLNVQNINITTNKANHLGGLASTIENVTLRNVHLKSGTVKNTSSIGESWVSTGGFVGSANNQTIIENCSTSINVSAEKNVGGFMGINMNSTIKDSYTNGKVSGSKNIGGFIGLQSINDTMYKVPENVYFDYSKTKISVAVRWIYSRSTYVKFTSSK